MSEWQPIETAPKKTRVLIFAGNEIRLARHDPQGWCWSDDFGYVRPSPTHWMPLPPPPQSME